MIHTHSQNLQGMVTPWPFHNWGLDLVGPVNPPSRGYIWILVGRGSTTPQSHGRSNGKLHQRKYNYKVGVPHRIISDNGTPFVNNDMRKMLEFYQVKHHRSSPYYPQGNGQAEATDKTLIKIISKMSQEYMGGWVVHLPDAL